MMDHSQESDSDEIPTPPEVDNLFSAIDRSPKDVPSLIHADANIEERNGYGGRTALLSAVDLAQWSDERRPWPDMLAAIKALLQAGADVEVTDKDGYTPLGIASEASRSYSPIMPEIVALLLKHAVDPNRLSEYGYSPLDRAYGVANGDIVRALWAAGARFAETVSTDADPLHRDQAELARAAELSLAALLGDTAYIDRLQEQGIDINSRDISGSTALHAASSNGDVEMVAHLLMRGADIHAHANYKGDPEGEPEVSDEVYRVPNPLYEASYIYPQQGNTPLHDAAVAAHPEVVRLLLSRGADIYALSGPSPLEIEPLVTAATSISINHRCPDDSIECVRILLEAGYKPDVPRSDEQIERNHVALGMALGAAAWGGELELISLLLEYGAGERRDAILSAMKRATTDNGFSSLVPLWEASRQLSPQLLLIEALPFLSGIWDPQYGHIYVALRTLFEAYQDIDVNAPHPSSRETPLLWIVRHAGAGTEYPYGSDSADIPCAEWTEMFEETLIGMLLERGADPNAQDNTGESALSVAQAKGYVRVAAQLQRPGRLR